MIGARPHRRTFRSARVAISGPGRWPAAAVGLWERRNSAGESRRFQCRCEVRGRLDSCPRIASQCRRDDLREIGRNIGIQFADRAERVVFFPPNHFLVRRAGERNLAGEQVVERRTECEDVAASVDEVGVQRLLVGHVVRRADPVVCGGELRIVVEPLGEAEVGELRHPVRMKEDVVRLHVAVNVLARVEECQGAGDVDPDLHRDADREATEASQGGVGGRAVDEFENQVVLRGELDRTRQPSPRTRLGWVSRRLRRASR